MLAVSKGRLICLSTPFGKRGFFHDCWTRGGNDWHRIEVPADRIPRITPSFLAEECRALGEFWFRQEYCCSFEALEGLVYPDFARCVMPGPAPAGAPTVGGIDFGFRNPFAALWGTVKDGVLILTGEHYLRERPLSHHAGYLPRGVMWYADPAGANEIAELLCAGFKVRRSNNSLAPGIAAVTDRLSSGRLRVLEGACPNLLAEAGLYRYGNDGRQQRSEIPIDEDNHALAALRYLICALDRRKMAGGRPKPSAPSPPATGEAPPPPKKRKSRFWEMAENPDVWTTFYP